MRVLVLLVFLNLTLTLTVNLAEAEVEQWTKVTNGFSIRHQEVLIANDNTTSLKSNLILGKFDPKYFSFAVGLDANQPKIRTDLNEIIKDTSIFAAINVNYFDQNNAPLGLIIKDGVLINKIHLGGASLTGIFAINNNSPQILGRDQFNPTASYQIALQAGPRLIANKQILTLKSTNSLSRRAGIAITSSNEVIIVASETIFPGITLTDFQQALANPDLQIKDAINCDGGGSTQIFFKTTPPINIRGDLVPVFLLVKKSGVKF